ncbi:MAG: hypothetical protein ABJB34_07105, partial [Acidobacteriota bacterium]
MKLYFHLFGFLFVVFLISLNAQPPGCLDLSPKTAAERAAAVFIGKIVSDAEVPAPIRNQKVGDLSSIVAYRMRVEQGLKGHLPKEVTVFTDPNRSPFSFPWGSGNPPDRNRTYLVYGHTDSKIGAIYFLPKCSGTQHLYSAGYYLGYFGIGERLKEIRNQSLVKRQAPKDSIRTFRELFNYVKKVEPDIVKDKGAQERRLSKAMRSALADSVIRAGSPHKNPDYPNNSLFLGVWNKPTTYSVVDTRYYDYHDKDNSKAKRVMIDVLYEWGQEETIDNQYAGVRNLRTYCLIFEDGQW